MRGILQQVRKVRSFGYIIQLPRQLYHHYRWQSLAVVGVIMLGLTALGVGLVHRSQASIDRPTLEIVTDLPFQAVLPHGTTIDQLGGWRRVSPPDSAPVFAYSDQIADVQIIVSEQQVPSSLKGDNKLAELAKKFSATDQLNITHTTAYIGTSAKGPQSVLLIKHDLLVLIKSKDNISDQDWIRYITSLR